MQPPSDPATLRSFLAQPFTLLGRGAKVKVYGSADGRVVLKRPVRPEELAAWFAEDGRPLLSTGWVADAADELAAARVLLARTESSYRLAAARLAEETGLIALHLDPTRDLRLSLAVDGRTLDADRESFILQWRARPLRACIDASVNAGDTREAERMLDDLIALTLGLWAKGVVDDTANFHTNYGTVGARLILFDIGELIESAERVRAERAAPKLLRKKGMAWLERRHPDLARYFLSGLRRAIADDAQIEAQ